jgi:hypothetical protein
MSRGAMNLFLENRSRRFIILSQVALLFFAIALWPTAECAIFCSQCGEKAPDGAEFCTGCGAPLLVPDAPRPETVEQRAPVSAETPTIRLTVKFKYAVPPSLGWVGKKRFLVYLDSDLVFDEWIDFSDKRTTVVSPIAVKEIVYDGSIRRGRHTVGVRTFSALSGDTSASVEKLKYKEKEFFVESPGVLLITVKQKLKSAKKGTGGPKDKLKEVVFKPDKRGVGR